MLGKFHNLALGDASDLVQMQPALAFYGLGSFRGTGKRVPDHRYRDYRGSHHGQNKIQIKEYKIQHPDAGVKFSRIFAGEPGASGSNIETATKKGYGPGAPTQRSLPESTGP